MMTTRIALLVAVLGLERCTGCGAAPAPRPPTPASIGEPRGSVIVPSSLRIVGRAELCVTQGALAAHPSGRLVSTGPRMRAVLAATTPPIAELRFTYLGPVLDAEPLGSGQMRRQIGLKLLAQDACNVIYVMWRFEPEARLVVSVKRNPGKRTSRECGNEGYTNVKPRRVTPVPALSPGSSHALRAALEADTLRVFVDEVLAWEGLLGAEALSFEGPVGVRIDNGQFELDLLAAGSTPGSPCGAASPSDPE